MTTLKAITTILIFTILMTAASLYVADEAQSRPNHWNSALTTWYGPGFYGNRFACAGKRAPDGTILPSTYRRRTRGVAHRTFQCGRKLTIRKWGRKVHVRVIDRGPYSGATFDLTARTAMDLCKCSRPYTMTVRWKRGWV